MRACVRACVLVCVCVAGAGTACLARCLQARWYPGLCRELHELLFGLRELLTLRSVGTASSRVDCDVSRRCVGRLRWSSTGQCRPKCAPPSGADHRCERLVRPHADKGHFRKLVERTLKAQTPVLDSGSWQLCCESCRSTMNRSISLPSQSRNKVCPPSSWSSIGEW